MRRTLLVAALALTPLCGALAAAEPTESDLSASAWQSDLEFLVDFYASEDGQRIVALGKRMDPLYVAAAFEAGREFQAIFETELEGNID